jgi:orotate phosphoribosyltransferase-like protein
MDGAEVIVDDILVHGKTLEEHNARLRKVLQKARDVNLKLNKKKSVYLPNQKLIMLVTS